MSTARTLSKMRNFRWKTYWKIFIFLTTSTFLSLVLLNFLKSRMNVYQRDYVKFVSKMPVEDTLNISQIDRRNYPKAKNFSRKDWHDWKFILLEETRMGPGEQGKGVTLTSQSEINKNYETMEVNGLSEVISDKISVNRSVPDTRPAKCYLKKYLENLPKVSIIVVFHNEVPSVLYRTIHSIFNRTPRELLHEIILVNDATTRKDLRESVEIYMKENVNGLVKILKLKTKLGLIVARMEGAKIATGEILVFLDAQCEVNVNWLPPLLEPIALDPIIATSPVLDVINNSNFEYSSTGDGFRGLFDWNFDYKFGPKRKGYAAEAPAENPIMMGFEFAINRQFFWDLGAYDEDFYYWNGANYELSFKLWLCGGEILEVPCSRVGHIFQSQNKDQKQLNLNLVARNLKRIAEIWLDKYKEFLYNRNPDLYSKINPGNLSKPKTIRERLKCKPFKHFLEKVAPELLNKFPIVPRHDFAIGTISPVIDNSSCLDASEGIDQIVLLKPCNSGNFQNFSLTWNRNIEQSKTGNCLESYKNSVIRCSLTTQDNLIWKYDLETQQLISGVDVKKCLTILPNNMSLATMNCNPIDIRQKWIWQNSDEILLKNWCKYGETIEGLC